MALNIKDPEADELARRLARTTGKSITEAVKNALRRDLAREDKTRLEMRQRGTRAVLERIWAMPATNPEFTEESLYDENGLPA